MLEKLVQRISHLFHKKEILPRWEDWQEKLCLSLEPGDIVYAWMPEEDIQGRCIPIGHDRRPYLIAGRQGLELLAYPMSSGSRAQHLSCRAQFPVWELDSTYKSNSRIQFNAVSRLSCDLLIERMDPLDSQWIPHIQRRIAVQNRKRSTDPLPGFACQPCFLPGDIVQAGNTRWLLIQMEGTFWKSAHLMTASFPGTSCIQIQGQTWYASPEETCLLNPSEMKLVWFTNGETSRRLLEPFKTEKKKPGSRTGRKPCTLPCTFDMDPGAVMPGWDDEQEYIYLFTLKGRRYGILVDWNKDQPLVFVKLPQDLPAPVSLCGTEEMEEYLEAAAHQSGFMTKALAQCRTQFEKQIQAV